MSTETTVRETIKTAIEGIAIHGLGFDSNVGAVKDHPLEYVREEVAARYLSNAVNGSITFRVWSVFVESREEAIAITSNGGVNVSLVERFYTVKVAGLLQANRGRRSAEHLDRSCSQGPGRCLRARLETQEITLIAFSACNRSRFRWKTRKPGGLLWE